MHRHSRLRDARIWANTLQVVCGSPRPYPVTCILPAAMAVKFWRRHGRVGRQGAPPVCHRSNSPFIVAASEWSGARGSGFIRCMLNGTPRHFLGNDRPHGLL